MSEITAKKLGEFGLISHLTGGLGVGDSRVVEGVGDDAAVVDTGADSLLLATCDIQIEGIHFTPARFTPGQIGRRAAAVNLSDIAAMGGRPNFALLSLAIPAETPVGFLEELYAGLSAQFGLFDVSIIGGNTAELPERVALDVALLGEVKREELLLRKGAEDGDLICVTGELGASAAGLALVRDSSIVMDETLCQAALSAHTVPIPRVREGGFLGKTGRVHSCIDTSDGLLADAGHIAEASGVSLVLDWDLLPVADAATELSRRASGISIESLVLGGGEDFELLFTTAPESAEDLLAELFAETGTPGRIIGRVERGTAAARVLRKGESVDLDERGFDHFY